MFLTEKKVARFSIMFGNLIVPPSFPLSNVDKPVSIFWQEECNQVFNNVRR